LLDFPALGLIFVLRAANSISRVTQSEHQNQRPATHAPLTINNGETAPDKDRHPLPRDGADCWILESRELKQAGTSMAEESPCFNPLVESLYRIDLLTAIMTM
jgi:hypothetical protein